MECVFPLVTSSCMKRRLNSKHADVFLSEYDQFDDYLEMVIQFGVSRKTLALEGGTSVCV